MFAWRFITTAFTFVGSFLKEYTTEIGAYLLGKSRAQNKIKDKEIVNKDKTIKRVKRANRARSSSDLNGMQSDPLNRDNQ